MCIQYKYKPKKLKWHCIHMKCLKVCKRTKWISYECKSLTIRSKNRIKKVKKVKIILKDTFQCTHCWIRIHALINIHMNYVI